MSREHKAWARRARRKLLDFLGGACVDCGVTENLEFDCIRPVGNKHGRKDTSARMCFYHGQFYRDNLQILCNECHTKKSRREAMKKAKAFELSINLTIINPDGSMTNQYT